MANRSGARKRLERFSGSTDGMQEPLSKVARVGSFGSGDVADDIGGPSSKGTVERCGDG